MHDRIEQVRDLLEHRRLAGVVLRTPPSFAWCTGGADNRVDASSPAGDAAVVVTARRAVVVTPSIEAARVREEVVPGWEVLDAPWWEGNQGLDAVVAALVDHGPVGSDLPSGHEIDLRAAVTSLRIRLDAAAVAQYGAVGADAVAAIDAGLEGVSGGERERELAAAVIAAAAHRGLRAPVVLVAGATRVQRVRHPVPTDALLGRHAMVVLCAERHGLVANVTRMVHLDEPDDQVRRRQSACDDALVAMRHATRPGATLGDVLDVVRRAYADAGEPDAWRDHHQGGVTGYRPREIVATPGHTQVVEVGHAYAWNPSLPGAKAEETFVLTDDGPLVVAR